MQEQYIEAINNPNTQESSGLIIAEGFGGRALPTVVTGPRVGLSWRNHFHEIEAIAKRELHKSGGILFRGFSVEDEKDFQKFSQKFGFPLLSYEFGSTPRTDLGEGVYTSTEYPPHQQIPLHNEQAYTLQWPMKIWFHCVTASEEGGETPIADSRAIYQKIDPAIRRRFDEKRLMYVRNYGNGLDVPWQQAFNVEESNVGAKHQVEVFCRQQNIEFEWKRDGELRTRQVCQATAKHPHTGDWVWFNQAHLFHVSNLEETLRETLLSIVSEEDLPRNVYYGDGSALEESILQEIRGVLAEESVIFTWQSGDLLMLDNMLTAHGRTSFKGDRKVVVAMAEGFDSVVNLS